MDIEEEIPTDLIYRREIAKIIGRSVARVNQLQGDYRNDARLGIAPGARRGFRSWRMGRDWASSKVEVEAYVLIRDGLI